MNPSNLEDSERIDKCLATNAAGSFNMEPATSRDKHHGQRPWDQDTTRSTEQKVAARAAVPLPTIGTNFPPPGTFSGIERIGFSDAPDDRFIPSAQRSFDALDETKKLQSSQFLSVSPAMEEKPLPNDFQPSEFTVIIGRGKKIRESQGNIHLRTLASTYLAKYSDSRQAKTEVVNSILGIIRAVCPNGGAFVRCEQGQWYEVGDRVAREKVGYVFRDLLSDKYESSCKSKTARRKRQQKEEQEQHQKELQEEQLRTQMMQIQERILMQHQQHPLNVANMATFPPQVERNVQRSFSDSGFSSMSFPMQTTPLQLGTSFMPSQATIESSFPAPFPPPAVRSLPSSPFVHHRQSLQQPLQPHRQQQMSMSMPVYTTLPLKMDSSSSSINQFSEARTGYRYASSSDCSEESSVSGLDDSSNTSVHGYNSKASRSTADFLSSVSEDDRKPSVTTRPMLEVLSGVTEGQEADLSGLLTSPLIDCHIEGKKEDEEDR